MSATAIPMPLSWSMRLLERDLLPDFLVRFGIRRLLRARLAEECQGSLEAQQRHLMKLIARLRRSPIAINTAEANLQHYELPSAFFELVLGRAPQVLIGLLPQLRRNPGPGRSQHAAAHRRARAARGWGSDP